MLITRQLMNHGEHVHRFVVTRDLEGWDVLEEEDTVVLKRVHRGRWQRVEADVQLFEMKVESLKDEGWIEN